MKKLLYLLFLVLAGSLHAQINQTEICKIALDVQLMRYKVYIDNSNTSANVDSIIVFRYINNNPVPVGKVHRDSIVFVDYSFTPSSLQFNSQSIKYALKETYNDTTPFSNAQFSKSHSNLSFYTVGSDIRIFPDYYVADQPIGPGNLHGYVGFDTKYDFGATFLGNPIGQLDTVLIDLFDAGLSDTAYGMDYFLDSTIFEYIYIYPKKNCQTLGNKSFVTDLMAFVNVKDYIENPISDNSSPALEDGFDTIPLPNISTKNYELFSFEIFPNPAVDVLNVQFDATSSLPVEIQIHDLQGKKIVSTKTQTTSAVANQLQIPISQLQSGVYFITIQSTSGKVTKKFIIK